MDQIAAQAVGKVAKPVDLAFDARISIDDRVAESLTFDEVLRELITELASKAPMRIFRSSRWSP